MQSSRLTEILQNRTLYADYIRKQQQNNQGCERTRTGLVNSLVAPGSIRPELLDGERNTTPAERDTILAATACSAPLPPNPDPFPYAVLLYDIGNADSYSGSGSTITDLSPSDYTGTLINSPTYSSTNGGIFTFTGSDSQYIDTNESIALDSFTLNAWVKVSDVTDYRMIISKETSSGAPWNYRLWISQTAGYPVCDIEREGGGNVQLIYEQNVADGNWHMVTVSRNASTHLLTMWIDNEVVSTVTDSLTGSIQTTQEVWIGQSALSGGRYPLKGSLGLVSIYNRVLSNAQVSYVFNDTKTRFGL
jgi:hypothetical protein